MNAIKLKQELTEKELAIFESEYSKAKRSMLVTYLFLPFVAFGVPFFYLGKKSLGFAFLGLLAVVVGASIAIDPGIGEVTPYLYTTIMAVCAFTLPYQVSKRNADIELQILKAIKGDGKVDRMWSVA